MKGLRGFLNKFVDALLYLLVTKIGPHTGAGSRHGLPVSGVHQNTFNKGPFSTHVRLNRMNGAQLIPKHTISAFSLGNQRFATRNLTVASYKLLAIQVQIPANRVNLRLGDIGTTVTLTALSTILAGK